MFKKIFTIASLAVGSGFAADFQEPYHVVIEGKPLQTDWWGYAAPGLHDLNGDGKKDLLVGQYEGGRIKIYPGKGDGAFGKGDWLKAGGEIAEIPGIW